MMVDEVFDPAPWLDDETLLVLKADVMAVKVRLTSGDGGCTEFLVGGKFANWRTDTHLRDIMSQVNATSDCIESVFGVLDNTLKFASDNLSKHSGMIVHCLHIIASTVTPNARIITRVYDIISLLHSYTGKALATWKTNHTDEWCRQLPRPFLMFMVKKSLGAGRPLKKRSDRREKLARKEVINMHVNE